MEVIRMKSDYVVPVFLVLFISAILIGSGFLIKRDADWSVKCAEICMPDPHTKINFSEVKHCVCFKDGVWHPKDWLGGENE